MKCSCSVLNRRRVVTPPLQFVFNTQLPGRDPHPRERPQFFPSPFKSAGQGAGTVFTFPQLSLNLPVGGYLKFTPRYVCLTTPGRAYKKPT